MSHTIASALFDILLHCRQDPHAAAMPQGYRSINPRRLALAQAFEAQPDLNPQMMLLPLLVSPTFLPTTGWSALAILILAEWVAGAHDSSLNLPPLDTWLTTDSDAVGKNKRLMAFERADLEPYWDHPMAWGYLPAHQVTLHGLWGLAQVSHHFTSLKSRLSADQKFRRPPSPRYFMQLTLTSADVRALMATALSVIHSPASPPAWRTEVARKLAIAVMQPWPHLDPLQARDVVADIKRVNLASAWAHQPIADRFEQLTAVCRLLTFNGGAGLVPWQGMDGTNHRQWFRGWAHTLDEAARAGLTVDAASVEVHATFLNSAVTQAREENLTGGWWNETHTGEVACLALRSLHALVPGSIDPQAWCHAYQSVGVSPWLLEDYREPQAIADIAQWMKEKPAQDRAARTLAQTPADHFNHKERQRS